LKTFAASLLAAIATATPDVAWESLGHFTLKNAAFPNISKFESSDKFLLCSSFGAFSSGHVYVVPDITEAVVSGDVSSLKAVKLDTPNFEWPNDVKVIPHDVFG
jgi:hypothetical protein